YWFFHAQDARSYGLGLLVSAWILASTARLLKAPQDRRALASLALATLLGCFVHYYLFLVSEAALAFLFLRRPSLRAPLAIWGAALLAALYAYLTLVERPHALVLMDHSWIGSSPAWSLRELTAAAKQTANSWTTPALLLCALGFGVAVVRERARPGEMMGLAAGVPILVLAGGIGASAVSAPNFTDRNFLLCSPFLWTLIAGLYDQAYDRPGRLAPWVTTMVAGAAAFSVGHVLWRGVPHNTPFRESARWIAQQSDCAGRPIPVLINHATPMTPAFTALMARADYGYYLPGHPLEPVFKEQLAKDARIPESGCSVVAWGGHYLDGYAEARSFARRLSARGQAIEVRAFTVPNDPRGARAAFVLVRKAESPAAAGPAR
ncbi:MAG: hypothetical protein ACXWKO_17395, partial [Phenylobacterium sp.]